MTTQADLTRAIRIRHRDLVADLVFKPVGKHRLEQRRREVFPLVPMYVMPLTFIEGEWATLVQGHVYEARRTVCNEGGNDKQETKVIVNAANDTPVSCSPDEIAVLTWRPV